MLEQLVAYLSGHLTPTARVWTALAPAIAACAYFILGLVAFSVRCVIHGVPRDAETLTRGGTVLVGMFLRHAFFWIVQPLWTLLLRSGIPANALTALAALLGVAAGWAVAAGRFALGGWLFLFSGILDTMDGRVARARNDSSPAGAALDSVLDRYVDSALLIGLAWYYRDTWVLLPVMGAFLGTAMVPYVRARGEGLGVALRGGAMQRLERMLFLGVGVALSPVLEAVMFPELRHPMHWMAVGSITFVAVLSNITALTRLRALINALSPPPATRSRPTGMLVALNGAAGAIATGVDFTCVLALVRWGGLGAVPATVLGAAVGALVNYALNRVLTFCSEEAVAPQMTRYALVSATSALLNTGGVALLTLHPDVHYIPAWWLARGAVYAAWNFPLQRDYVFLSARTAR